MSMRVNGQIFSNLVGVSRQYIARLADSGTLNRKNNMYDLSDSINESYLISKGITKADIKEFYAAHGKTIRKPRSANKNRKSNTAAKKRQVPPDSAPLSLSEEPDDDDFENVTGLPSKMMNLTLKQLVTRYGGPMMLKNWTDILNKLMQAEERDQKLQERRLELIEKDFVIKWLFRYIEVLSQQLFDYPESIIDTLIASITSGGHSVRMQIVDDMKKEIGLMIGETKSSIDKELNRITSRYKKQDIDSNDE